MSDPIDNLMRQANRVAFTSDQKSAMHERIDSLEPSDHAILIRARSKENGDDLRTLDIAWMNVSGWQAEGMLRYGIRAALLPDDDK